MQTRVYTKLTVLNVVKLLSKMATQTCFMIKILQNFNNCRFLAPPLTDVIVFVSQSFNMLDPNQNSLLTSPAYSLSCCEQIDSPIGKTLHWCPWSYQSYQYNININLRLNISVSSTVKVWFTSNMPLKQTQNNIPVELFAAATVYDKKKHKINVK